MAAGAKRLEQRVWIELPRPLGKEDGEKKAELLCKMLKRLGVERDQPVWWNHTKLSYCFEIDSSGAFVEAADNGHWFNLEYFGRD